MEGLPPFGAACAASRAAGDAGRGSGAREDLARLGASVRRAQPTGARRPLGWMSMPDLPALRDRMEILTNAHADLERRLSLIPPAVYANAAAATTWLAAAQAALPFGADLLAMCPGIERG